MIVFRLNSVEMELITAYDLYKLEQADELLETGLQSLDALLGGGISPGTFLEIVGPSATGKSQFCMQLAVNLQKNKTKKDSVYVDTEGGFHTKRICDIATKILRTTEPLGSLKHIRVSRCRDLVELTSTVHRLEFLVQQNPEIGLIIVDSVAMPLRGENDYALRSRLEISRIISKLASSYRLIVNFQMLPSMSHRPSTRLWLCLPDAHCRNSWIFLTKSPSAPNGSIPFKITEGGLVEIDSKLFVAYSVACCCMKFLAVLAESGAADTLSKITEFISKLCKDKVTLRITSDAVYLLNPCPSTNGDYLQITLNVAEFFSTYIMGGVSEEFNEIYMEVEKDHLFESMNVKDRSTKIRLIKLDNVPHLKVEQRSCGMTHELPVILIPTKYWKSYDMPALSNISVTLHLPPLSTVRSLVTSFKNMGVKYMEIKGSQEGELQFCGDLDMANIAVHFSNLSAASLKDGHGSFCSKENETVYSCIPVDDADGQDVLQTVRIDIRAVYLFLRSFSTLFTMSRILLRIIPQKMAVFSVEQNETSLLYIVSGMA
uniref:DNA repair protein RAD51 homolog 3 n=1 Tax=Elaeophora elaphi TaxID=1147741 RepID=A0A0R3S312_9BILA